MTVREEFLGKVRQALGRSSHTEPPSPPAVRLRPRQWTASEKLRRFEEALHPLNVGFWPVDDLPGARAAVMSITGETPAAAAPHPLLERAGILSSPNVASNFSGEPELRQAAASAAFGITSAEYALADTGSLVFLAGRGSPRMLSLLPPVHIAVLRQDQLLSGLDELFGLLPEPASATSSLVLITGSSRTGDIEQILVPGVHGPGKVHIVLIRSAV